MTSIEANYLINASYETQRAFCDKVLIEVKRFLSIKYPNRENSCMKAIFEVLLQSSHNNQAELAGIKYTAINLLAGFTDPKMKEIFNKVDISDATVLFVKLLNFADQLIEEYAEAELDIEMLDNYGTENIQASINLHIHYAKKIKLAVYEKNIEGDPIE